MKNGIGNKVVGIKDNEIYNMDIIEAISLPRKFNKELYALCKRRCKIINNKKQKHTKN